MRRWRDTATVARSTPLAALVLGVLVACEPVPVSGNPLQPVALTPPAPPAQVQPAQTPGAEDPAFDFDSEDRTADGSEAEPDEDPLSLQARLLGVDPAVLTQRQAQPPPPPVEPEPEPEPEPVEPPQLWDPSEPLVEARFGVRALATLTDVQPPRAIIGMPDGSEQVVQAGTILPDQGLVVMAIGRDVVQLARVIPEGYYARIDTQTLQTLLPGSGRSPSQ